MFITQKMDHDNDSIVLYAFDSMKYSMRETLGIEKNKHDIFL